MWDFVTDRIAYLIAGVVVGFFIAIGVFVFLFDLDQWWIFVVVPLVCGILCALVGEKALDALKQIASGIGWV